MFKKLLIIPAIVFMSQGVFADEHGQPPPQDDGYYDQQQGPIEQPQYGGPADCCGAVLPPVYPVPCCGAVVPQPLPPPPPPPVVYNPAINYYGCPGCVAPVMPYGPPPVAVVPHRPIYGGVYGRPVYRGRPFMGRPGFGPRPYVRHMSAEGCAVEQGNNGVFSVISLTGEVLYQNDSTHAAENADYMKAWYEKNNATLCGGVDSSANKALDI